MALQVTDGLQRRSLPQEVESVGMANAMDPFEGDRQSAPARPCLKRLDHASWLQCATRSSEAKEDFPMVAIARYPSEVVLNREGDLIGQREFQGPTRFALANLN